MNAGCSSSPSVSQALLDELASAFTIGDAVQRSLCWRVTRAKPSPSSSGTAAAVASARVLPIRSDEGRERYDFLRGASTSPTDPAAGSAAAGSINDPFPRFHLPTPQLYALGPAKLDGDCSETCPTFSLSNAANQEMKCQSERPFFWLLMLHRLWRCAASGVG